MYYLFILLSLIITVSAQIYVKSMFKKYSEVRNERGLTGAEAARQLLLEHGVTNVSIEPIAGSLTDHYDPTSNVIRLSEDVYDRATVAAVGVAMHEAGHALQYAESYAPVRIRSAIVKFTNISSMISYVLVLMGVLFSSYNLLTLGIIFFLAVIFFQLVTLPVEFNASGRAVRALRENGLLNMEEQQGVRKVLTAAAMTYVAAVAVSLLNLIRLLAIRGRRR